MSKHEGVRYLLALACGRSTAGGGTARLIAGVLLALAVTGGVDASETKEPRAPHKLYASAETVDALGPVSRHLATWAGADLLAVARQDLPVDHRSSDVAAIRAAFDAFTDEIPHFPFDRSSGPMDVRVMVSRAAAGERPAAFPLPARDQGGRDACIVTLPNMDEDDPRRVVADFQNIPPRYLENLPGSAEEWRIVIVAHEVGHCRHELRLGDFDPVRKLLFELEADQEGIDRYVQYMLSDGGSAMLGKDVASVPRALKRLRAVQSIAFDRHGHYANSAGLHVPGAPAPPTTEPERLLDAKARVQGKLWEYAITGVVTVAHNGLSAARPSPGDLYRAALSLREQAYFADAPVERRFLEQFLEGVEMHYPRYFEAQAE